MFLQSSGWSVRVTVTGTESFMWVGNKTHERKTEIRKKKQKLVEQYKAKVISCLGVWTGIKFLCYPRLSCRTEMLVCCWWLWMTVQRHFSQMYHLLKKKLKNTLDQFLCLGYEASFVIFVNINDYLFLSSGNHKAAVRHWLIEHAEWSVADTVSLRKSTLTWLVHCFNFISFSQLSVDVSLRCEGVRTHHAGWFGPPSFFGLTAVVL